MNKTLIEGIDFYYDENNYVVFNGEWKIFTRAEILKGIWF